MTFFSRNGPSVRLVALFLATFCKISQVKVFFRFFKQALNSLTPSPRRESNFSKNIDCFALPLIRRKWPGFCVKTLDLTRRLLVTILVTKRTARFQRPLFGKTIFFFSVPLILHSNMEEFSLWKIDLFISKEKHTQQFQPYFTCRIDHGHLNRPLSVTLLSKNFRKCYALFQ